MTNEIADDLRRMACASGKFHRQHLAWKAADEIERLSNDNAICRSAIEDAVLLVDDWIADDANGSDMDQGAGRATRRMLSEAIGKATPRLLMERPEGQKFYGLRWREMNAEIELLRGNLSLAEEGLANYALEVERLRAALRIAADGLWAGRTLKLAGAEREYVYAAKRAYEAAGHVPQEVLDATSDGPSDEPNPHYVPDCITTEIPAAEPSEVLDHQFIPDGMDPGICQKCGSTKGSHRGGKRTGE